MHLFGKRTTTTTMEKAHSFCETISLSFASIRKTNCWLLRKHMHYAMWAKRNEKESHSADRVASEPANVFHFKWIGAYSLQFAEGVSSVSDEGNQ